MTEYRFGVPDGPCPADVMVVGEAFGAEEARIGKPFVGSSGRMLSAMLHEAGIFRAQVRVTNVVNARPPGNKIDDWFYTSKTKAASGGLHSIVHGKYPKKIIFDGLKLLAEEIARCNPKVIIALGNTALWALTGENGITKWRGSLLGLTGPVTDVGSHSPTPIVVPTYHPAAILRQWSWRQIAVHDMQYAGRQVNHPQPTPLYNFVIRPTFSDVMQMLADPPERRISCDIETRQGQIACLGLGFSDKHSWCIPFLVNDSKMQYSYWTPDQEADIVLGIRRMLLAPNTEVVWQNGLYDIQYIWNQWKFIPRADHDTMLMQHTAFPGLPKGLDFLASMYCSYRRYWKDEGKEWHKSLDEDQLWTYNCKDAVVTWEIVDPLMDTIRKLHLEKVYEHSMSLYEPVLFMMINGVLVDKARRESMSLSLDMASHELQAWLDEVFGERINVRSTPQMRRLFYDEMGMPVIKNRKTGSATLGGSALHDLAKKEPILWPLTERIAALRSVGVFKGTFINAKLDPDGRMRCSYNIGGTETGRFSSSTNAFGRGTNLENIPRPPDEKETPLIRLPNVRSMFVPDRGMVIADFDLDRADAHIVAWEAQDDKLKEMFRQRVDIHTANADIIGTSRQLAKTFVHGTNYGGGPRTMARHCGISIRMAERAQHLWFVAHPAIKEWHERVEYELTTKHSVTTVFGRKRHYFDRIDVSRVQEALAYLGQSPVADVINRGLRRIYLELPWCELLLQNHDSVVVQFPTDNLHDRVAQIIECLSIPLPYADPLTIPVGCKLSDRSWGELEEFKNGG